MTKFLFIGEPIPPFFAGTGPEFPDRELVSLDDEQVKAIMLQLGETMLFTEGKKYDGECQPGEADITAFTHGAHPTHWFLFVRWEHAPDPKDNGYALHGYPKSKYSAKEFWAKVEDFMGRSSLPHSRDWVVEEGDKSNWS